MVVLTSVPDGELWRSFPESNRSDILGLLTMLLERWAVSAGLAAEGTGGEHGASGERGDGKIQGWHRDRLAVIYVRQSSRQQVADHGESTRLQYGLTGRAAALGWPASRVMVIDEDLGRSAANAAERPGFRGWSRRSRWGTSGWCWAWRCRGWPAPGQDWHQLIELCSLAGALLADADGVHDRTGTTTAFCSG